MTRDGPLAYSGFSPKLLERLEKQGVIVFKPFGPRGAPICQREQIDRARELMFGTAMEDLDGEFDGLG